MVERAVAVTWKPPRAAAAAAYPATDHPGAASLAAVRRPVVARPLLQQRNVKRADAPR